MSDVRSLSLNLPRASLAARAAAAISGAVQSGRWRVGDRLPSEPELAQELGISRPTLREALRLLVSDGLLHRRHGVGTFVERVPTPSIERGIDELFSLNEAIEQLGYRPGVGDCRAVLTHAGREIAQELGLVPGAQVCHVRRVRLADDRPVILCDDYFDAEPLAKRSLSPGAVASEIARGGSLYGWLAGRLGVVVDSALTRIEPVSADETVAAALDVAKGAALLRLRQRHYSTDGTPVLYSENVHNSDVMHFHVVRRRARLASGGGRREVTRR